MAAGRDIAAGLFVMPHNLLPSLNTFLTLLIVSFFKLSRHSNFFSMLSSKLIRLFSLAVSLMLPTVLAFGQGQFAGSMKAMVNQTYRNSRNIPALEGFDFQEGSLVSGMNDSQPMLVDVFNKDNTAIVFFSVMEDTTAHKYTIMDVVEVKNIQPGWEVRTGFCRQRGVGSADIVAVVKTSNQAYLKNVREAWRFNRDKRKFYPVNVKEVDCQQGW